MNPKAQNGNNLPDSPPSKQTSDYAYKKAKGSDPSAHVTRSRQKQAKLIDDLRPHLLTLPDRANRNDVLSYAKRQLDQHPGRVKTIEEILHHATGALCRSLEYLRGELLNLSDAWQKLIGLLSDLDQQRSTQLNKTHYKEAFCWQVGGHFDALGEMLNPVECVEILERTKPPNKGKIVQMYRLKTGELVPVPENPEPEEPWFLCPRDSWRGKPVTDYAVTHLKLPWPCPELEEAMRLIVWEPSGATLRRLAKKREATSAKRRRKP